MNVREYLYDNESLVSLAQQRSRENGTRIGDEAIGVLWDCLVSIFNRHRIHASRHDAMFGLMVDGERPEFSTRRYHACIDEILALQSAQYRHLFS